MLAPDEHDAPSLEDAISVLSWLLIAVGVFLVILAVLFLYVTARTSLSGAPIE